MTATHAAQTLDDRRRWIALVVLCVGMLMIVLDTTVVNVALPSIQEDLGFSAGGLAWVVNAYLIAFGGLLLLAGRLGDLISRRGVFLAGLAVFTLSSIACGLAPSQEVLVAARFVQGVGGALTSAVILGMIVTMFPPGAEQAKAIGVFAFVASAGSSIGLLAGGVLTDAINWHWIFFINVPIGIVTAVLATRLLPRDRGAGLAAGADVLGALLITTALMLLVYTLVKPAADHGWGAPETLGLGALALALGAAFVAREATAATPLVPLRIFRSRNVVGANLIQVLSVAGMFGMFFMGTLYLERVLRYDAMEIGLSFLPGTLLMGGLSLGYTDKLIMRFGARNVMVPGLVLVCGALAWFTQISPDGTYVVDVLPAMVLFGVGGGTAFPALMTLAMAGVEPQDAGLASGLINTTAQVGGAIGLAVLATLSATRAETLTGEGKALGEALTGGYQLAFVVALGLALAALLVAVLVIRPVDPTAAAGGAAPEPPQAERDADRALAQMA
ncbi:MAG TPA: DHA2 family efflux MFS transporter permease subunit [Baekduia sp.]|uniref:DHA2 family efflux MFS transporter permease subunit n=1 Tax=Baekduia sp. TaxID=2600305 RepID=UPI002D77C1C3|nr:DHA2 family efflux MFS transporter permease subunit [Baekduia sp.]HET6507812.1 DHA2 family efflux MFS transporter permease subunit [Baekduia sp.]